MRGCTQNVKKYEKINIGNNLIGSIITDIFNLFTFAGISAVLA